MKRLKNGIYATAMDMRIKNAYEEIEIEDEDLAEFMFQDWLSCGVPDGNALEDNIVDFGEEKDYQELVKEYLDICEYYQVCPRFEKEIEKVEENIVETLDNPYTIVV